MDSTVIRNVSMTAMLLGPSGEVSDRVAIRFEEAHMKVVRVGHAAAACERIAVAMPQVVVVLGTLRPDERDALLMYVDPELDAETLEELVVRAAQAAIERRISRDESAARGAPRAESPDLSSDEEVDSKW